MSSMRQTMTTVSSSSTNHENNLDALLDDLQSSISRSGSSANMNGNITGYREVRRTVTDGTPGGTSTQYHIEYLHPANTTTHISETSHHNGLNSGDFGGTHNVGGYKEVAYKYQTSTSKDAGSGDVRLHQNISELDSLLNDLHTAQQSSFSESSTIGSPRNISGVDSGLLESIPGSRSSSRSIDERHFREERRPRGRSSSPSSARRELVFTGSRSQDPSPVRHEFRTLLQEQGGHGPARQQLYRYEKTTTTRTTAPTITDITPVETVRSYTYPGEDAPPRALMGRPASPGGVNYQYSTIASSREPPHVTERVERVTKYSTTPRETEPHRVYPGTGGRSSQHSYSYSSTSTNRESRPEVPRTPPPHRSPSPVSFPQPPEPNLKAAGKPYQYESPPSPQRFTDRKFTYNVSPPHHTVTTYKYTTTSSSSGNRYPEEVPLLPRPFPTPSPTPEQQPPKKLDDLMASFSDTDPQYHTREVVRRYEKQHHLQSSRGGDPKPPSPPSPPPMEKQVHINKQVVERKEESKNVAGPPVYYPPGELFTKKEESMMARQAGGGKYKEKSKYEYEASSRSKSKETSGKAIVPVCLPLCCGLPCVIM